MKSYAKKCLPAYENGEEAKSVISSQVFSNLITTLRPFSTYTPFLVG